MSLPFKEWEDLSKLTGNILRPGGLDITNYALDNCNFKHEHYLLDLGCGLGGTIKHLSALGYNALGIDLSSELLQKAKIHTTKCLDATEIKPATVMKLPAFVQANMQNIPLKDACIHGVFCECVLSLFQNKEAIISELYRILYKCGKLIISDIVRKNSDIDLSINNNELGYKNTGNIANVLSMDTMFVGDINNSSNDATMQRNDRKISCMEGAIQLNKLKNLLCGNGFKIIIEKDYTRCLAELAAKLVLHDLSLKDYFLRGEASSSCRQNNDLAYFLLIAEKI